MENKPSEKNNEVKPDLFEEQPSAPHPAGPEKPAAPVKPAPQRGRASRFFRRLLWWSLLLAIFFVAGMAVTYFGIYRPELARLQDYAASAEESAQALEDEKAALEARVAELEPAGAENERLSLHNAVLSVKNDVLAAHLALIDENPAAARVSLNNTERALADIKGRLESEQQQAITDIETRLANTIDIMERNREAALTDFGILEMDLLRLENDLFLP